MRLFFLIRSLGHGGAERQLIELVRTLARGPHEVTVATFYDGGALRGDLERAPGVRLLSLGKGGRWDIVPFLWRLHKAVRAARPEVIHGYLDVGNTLALLMGKLHGAKVVWGLRMSTMDFSQHEWLAGITDRIGAWVSRFPDLLIANSETGGADYRRAGYHGARMVVVPNGIDVERFRPDPAARDRVRQEWGISAGELVIGAVGRIDPQKDYGTFLRAAALALQVRPTLRFVVVGSGPQALKAELVALAATLGIADRVRWIDGSGEMPAVYNAFDLSTLTSAYGDAFPNVVGEAMACGIPVVSTEVGDAPLIIGAPERIVPRQDPGALAAVWERVLALPEEARRALGAAQRQRMVDAYTVDRLAERTSTLLEGLVR